MSLQVQLKTYEGPLDLLLDLIKENKVDIYDIPIAEITDQYMAYLGKMEELNLVVAGEFLVMASTLVYIKSRMLLPQDEVLDEDEEEELDPRTELVNKLLEYQAFKEAARDLEFMQNERQLIFTRAQQIIDLPQAEDDLGLSTNLYDLIQAFSRVLRTHSVETFHEIYEENISIEQREQDVLAAVARDGQVRFSDLFKGQKTRNELIVTFLAILELIKGKQLCLAQSELFGEIIISKREQQI